MKAITLLLILIGFTAKSQTSSYSTPHNYFQVAPYTPDFESIERALSQKQATLDARIRELSVKATSIYNLSSALLEKHTLNEDQLNYIISFNNECQGVFQWDFSVYENYANVYNWLSKVEKTLYTWL